MQYKLNNIKLKKDISKKDTITFLVKCYELNNIVEGKHKLDEIINNETIYYRGYYFKEFAKYFYFDFVEIFEEWEKDYDCIDPMYTKAKEWYNTLSEEEKNYINYLGVGPAMA